MAKNTETVTDEELDQLNTECLQSLDSEDDESSDNSSDSSGTVSTNKQKQDMELLTPSPKSFDKTNPYNQAFLLTPQFQGYQQEFGSLPQHHLASHRQLVTHPNIQFFPHQGPHNLHYHAQMMPQRQTGHTRMYNPNMGSTPPNVQQFNTVISSASCHCGVVDPQIVSADPSHSGLQQAGEQHVTPRQEFLSPTSLHVSADPCEQGGTPHQELVPPSSLHVSADPCE